MSTRMSISEKIKTIVNKIEQNKAQKIETNKLLRFLLYHQETLATMDF